MRLVIGSFLAVCLIACIQASLGQITNGTAGTNRSPKVFSLFNVVTWKQTACTATTSNTQFGTDGTCMTAAQCSSTSGGTASGTCAAGFGVCCVVSLNTCGGTITQNCTYITNPGYPSSYDTSGTCTYTIKKCSTDICMVRLDFDQFTLSAPNTVGTDPLTSGACAIDSFTPVEVTGVQNRPVICGDNTGQHMYLNAVDGSSANLGFAIAIAQSTSLTNNLPRKWIIKVSQLPCGGNTPDPTCTQYFTGNAGTIKSYNFGSASYPVSHLLGGQNYQVCIRQQDNKCQVAYSACPNDPMAFTITGTGPPPLVARNGKGCTKAFVGIVDGHNGDRQCLSNTGPASATYRFCGNFLNCIDNNQSGNQVIYQSTEPFGFHVYSDDTANNYITNLAKGFCLNYNQIPC